MAIYNSRCLPTRCCNSSAGGTLLARNRYQTIGDIYLNQHLSAQKLTQIEQTVEKAASYDRFESLYPYTLGNVQLFQNKPEMAMTSYMAAALRNPMEGIYLQRIGLILSKEAPEKAQALITIGYNRTQNKEKSVLVLTEWLLKNGKRREAITTLKNGMQLHARLAPLTGAILTSYSFTQQEIAEILPETPEAWIRFATFLERQGNLEESEYFRNHALDFLDRVETIKPMYFTQLINHYQSRNQDEKALVILKRAIEWLPEKAEFHIMLGDYYLKQGVTYRAKEEYEQALLLDPVNVVVREKSTVSSAYYTKSNSLRLILSDYQFVYYSILKKLKK